MTDLEEKIEGRSPVFYLLIQQLKTEPLTASTFLSIVVLVMMALTILDFWLTGVTSLLTAFSGLKIAILDLYPYTECGFLLT